VGVAIIGGASPPPNLQLLGAGWRYVPGELAGHTKARSQRRAEPPVAGIQCQRPVQRRVDIRTGRTSRSSDRRPPPAAAAAAARAGGATARRGGRSPPVIKVARGDPIDPRTASNQ